MTRAERRSIGRRVALPLVTLVGLGLAAVALERIGISHIGHALLSVNLLWALAALAVMCTSMVLRGES
jgi:uncharacterized membrane protein YbhN (UPF0104 family)